LRAGSAALIEWLTDHHALPFELVDDFNYPGHSALRMHGLPSRTGRELIDRLRHAAEQREIVILTEIVADRLLAEADGRVCGVQTAERAGAILTAQSIGELAAAMRVPADVLGKEWNYVEALKARGEVDRYGRPFAPEQRLLPPFRAVKVTGALFHTQGGLAIDAIGRVKRNDGTIFPNLFAAGGAAAGVSGTTAAGYLSGNGLLTATVLGRFAGEAAAALVLR